MARKIRVAVLFGGRSAEHEVSLQSARSILEAIDKNKYDVVPIAIDKAGRWYLNDASRLLLHADDPKSIKLNNGSRDSVALVPAPSGKQEQLISLTKHEPVEPIDVVFPVLHGTYGEDGTVQGLLKLANIPFVGPSVLGSAVGMDKDVTKRLLREAGIPVARFLVFERHRRSAIDFGAVTDQLGLPLFVKPANLGSSVGVSKAKDEREFKEAIALAFEYDTKILIEEAISGREIECAVLGNEEPMVSIPGEIVPTHEFYSYEAKYIDEKGALLEIPAKLTPEQVSAVQDLSARTFKALCCEGMARVDCFLTCDGQFLVNEINTIPGFTTISMYPKLWEASGLPYTELVDRLIQLAVERWEREQALKTSRQL
ncbi:MAG TPA: D-alanine--D-alanine ligase [Candidatus Obscuribacterales bacterium]